MKKYEIHQALTPESAESVASIFDILTKEECPTV